MPFHKDLLDEEIHTPFFRIYANASDRANDIPENAPLPAILAQDVIANRVALQRDNGSFWRATNHDPLTWLQIAVGTGAAALPYAAITDPAVDAAVDVVVIDANAGTVITLTTTGNSQTMAAPTDTTAGKIFTIVNNDTSTDPIQVNGITVASGTYLKTEWDGTAWIVLGAGSAASPGGPDTAIQRNASGAFAGSINHTFDPATNRERVLGDIEQVGGTAAELYTPTQVSATPVGTNPRFAVVQANYLYVCDANDNDLRIYDVTDPSAPALVGSVVIGGGRGVDVAGRYIYYTDEDNGGRLVVVDVIDKSSPVVVGSVVTGGSPRGVKVQGRFAFVSYNASTDGLRAFDVSDPTAPVLLDSFNTFSPGRTDFDISGQTLALPGSNNLQLIDISDPFNLASIAAISGDTHTAKYQGRYLYTARENTPTQFEIWDVGSNPSAPILVGTLALTTPSVRSISVSGNFAYFVDASNDEMRVVDISDPTAPVFISTAVSVGLNPIAITTVGRYAYVLDNNGDQFLIMDLRGIDAQNLNVGNIDAGNINLRKDLKIGGVISVGAGTFGAGGLFSDGHIAAKGRLLGGLADNIVEVYKEADLPIIGSTIELVQGVVYELRRPISTDKQIIIPDTSGAFVPAVLRSSNKELNKLTSTGTGGAFVIGPGSGQGQLVLQNMIVEQTGARVFAILTGNAQIELLLELDDTVVSGFDDGSMFTNCIFNANNESFVGASGVFTLIDCESNLSDIFTANFVDSLMSSFDVKSSSASVIPTFFAIRTSKLSSQVNEAFFMLHSNLIAGSTVRVNGIEASPFTPGTGAFFDSQSGSITALADSGGAPGVRTVVTSSGHNVAEGDTVVHAGFTSATQLNGTFIASDVGVNSYEVVAVFTVTDTGTWQNDSLDEKSVLVTAFGSPGQADSKTIGSLFVSGNTDETVIATQNVFTDLDLGTALEASNIQRWSLTDPVTGELTYNGIEPFSGAIFMQCSATGAAGSPEYRFRAVKNGAVLPDDIETVLEAPAANISSVGLIAPVMVVTGDTVRLQVINIDNTNNITISHLSMSIQ